MRHHGSWLVAAMAATAVFAFSPLHAQSRAEELEAQRRAREAARAEQLRRLEAGRPGGEAALPPYAWAGAAPYGAAGLYGAGHGYGDGWVVPWRGLTCIVRPVGAGYAALPGGYGGFPGPYARTPLGDPRRFDRLDGFDRRNGFDRWDDFDRRGRLDPYAADPSWASPGRAAYPGNAYGYGPYGPDAWGYGGYGGGAWTEHSFVYGGVPVSGWCVPGGGYPPDPAWGAYGLAQRAFPSPWPSRHLYGDPSYFEHRFRDRFFPEAPQQAAAPAAPEATSPRGTYRATPGPSSARGCALVAWRTVGAEAEERAAVALPALRAGSPDELASAIDVQLAAGRLVALRALDGTILHLPALEELAALEVTGC